MAPLKKSLCSKSFAELRAKATDSLRQYKNTAPCVLERTLDPIIQAADSCYKDGDEENAFTLYYRYIEIVQRFLPEKIRSSGDPKIKKNFAHALERCEALKESLEKRYSTLEAEIAVDSAPLPPKTPLGEVDQFASSDTKHESGQTNDVLLRPISALLAEDHKSLSRESTPSALPARSQLNNSNLSPLSNSLPSEPKGGSCASNAVGSSNPTAPPGYATNGQAFNGLSRVSDAINSSQQADLSFLDSIHNGSDFARNGPQFITSTELHELLSRGRVLVLDCRSADAFSDSHILPSDNVINISKTYMGMTSHRIREQLSLTDKDLYDKRHTFDKVVIVDGDGTGCHAQSSAASCVAVALQKWVDAKDAITCVHLKHGYKFWVTAYPCSTTNSRPSQAFDVKPSHFGCNMTLGRVSSVGGVVAGKVSRVEDLMDFSWTPASFKTEVPVVSGSSITPTVTQTGHAISGGATSNGAKRNLDGDDHRAHLHTFSKVSTSPLLPAASSRRATAGEPTAAVNGFAGEIGKAPDRPVSLTYRNRSAALAGLNGDVRMLPANTLDSHNNHNTLSRRHERGSLDTDRSELSRVDQTSQIAIKQFADSVNERISSAGDSLQKIRTLSEAGSGCNVCLPESQHPLRPTTLQRSLSLSDLYEDSPNRAAGFIGSRGSHQDDVPSQDYTHLPSHDCHKRPSVDRSLKPSTSLDAAAAVHRFKDLSIGDRNNAGVPASVIQGHNHELSSVENGTHVCDDHTAITSTAPSNQSAFSKTIFRPSIPPRSRRSQSPVQAYRFGTTDRTSGLRNLGNTCYMNSVLQALAHSTEFAQFFVGRSYEQELNPSNPRGTRGQLPALLSHLLAELWSQRDTRDAVVSFRSFIGSLYSMYATYDQQDSHEFLVNLLDKLHEDLNCASGRNQKSSTDNSQLVVTFPMLAKELNKFFTAHNDLHRSVITRNFEGILVSGLKCSECGKDSYTFQVFNVLSVPIPSEDVVDIFDCFDEFFREEKVDEWHCPHCKIKRTATKYMRIARLPKHLIIHLVRFKNESWASFSFSSFKKITKVVRFSEELDTRELAQYVYAKEVKLKSYTLYAIVNHYGTISSGHYCADCRFLPKSQWYRYNDQQVSPLQNRSLDVSSAYMLFYSCVD